MTRPRAASPDLPPPGPPASEHAPVPLLSLLALSDSDERTLLDCVDEAVNTWTYMTMMERAGLLRFHTVAELGYAGLPTDTNPRNTAVLREKASGALYAVDASLTDGGEPPYVMPLTVWAGDWPPKLAEIENAGRPAKPDRAPKTAALAR